MERVLDIDRLDHADVAAAVEAITECIASHSVMLIGE